MRNALRAFARVTAIAIGTAVAILSLTPDTEDLEGATDIFMAIAAFFFGDPELGDKVSHFLAYGALGGMSVFGFARSAREGIMVFVGLLVFGTLLEFAQGLGGVRETDALDLVANFAGLLTGMTSGAIAILLYRRMSPQP
ncbi:MAG: VanZ family protein [Pseudomonadota bacterium]